MNEEPEFDWQSIEEDWERGRITNSEPSAVGNIVQKSDRVSPGIVEKMLRLARITDGIVALSVYPDGSAKITTEQHFASEQEVYKWKPN